MARLRINEVLKEHGLKQKDLAEKMGIKPISLNQMLDRETFGVDRLCEMAEIIGCKVTELFEEDKKSDFAAFVRFKGIHYVSDNLEDFLNQVEEIKLIAKCFNRTFMELKCLLYSISFVFFAMF